MAKKKAPRKTIKKAAPKARPRTPVKPRPQTRPLPGMEQLGASRPLDRICSSLADVRTQKNDLIEQESGLLTNACQVMQAEKRSIYRGHGVELVYKQGAARVTAKLTKDGGTAMSDDDLDNGAEGDVE